MLHLMRVLDDTDSPCVTMLAFLDPDMTFQSQVEFIKDKNRTGEKFDGKVSVLDKHRVLPCQEFEYAGEYRLLNPDEYAWAVNPLTGNALYFTPSVEQDDELMEILRLVPDEPKHEYKVGDWIVVSDGTGLPRQITGVNYIEHGNPKLSYWRVEYGDTGIYMSAIRPAVPQDFAKQFGKLWAIVYENGPDGWGALIVRWSDESCNTITPAVRAALGLTPCPLSVSKGKFEAPKGE